MGQELICGSALITQYLRCASCLPQRRALWPCVHSCTYTPLWGYTISVQVVTRSNEFRFAERSRQIRKYFYGVTTRMFAKGGLRPFHSPFFLY